MLEVMGHMKRSREFDRLFRAHEYEAALEQVAYRTNFEGHCLAILGVRLSICIGPSHMLQGRALTYNFWVSGRAGQSGQIKQYSATHAGTVLPTARPGQPG